jgi:hypothetical protein
MKRTCVVLFLLLPGFKLGSAPHIEVKQPLWNFGAVTNVSEVEHDFIIRNSGDEVLHISQVLSSCNACLDAGIDRNSLAPGSNAVVRCRLALSQVNGFVSRMVLLGSNDPKTPFLYLELRGSAVPAYRLDPPDVNLDLTAGETVAMVKIIPLLKLQAPLSQAFCENTNLELCLIGDGVGGFVLEVKPLPGMLHGDIYAEVKMASINSNDLPCRVACSIHNPPDLELIPAQLNLQALDEPQRRILWIRQRGMSPLILLDVLPSSDNIKCEIVPESNRFNYRVNVAAWGQKNNTGHTNWLTLKMRDGNLHERLVSVPVSVN